MLLKSIGDEDGETVARLYEAGELVLIVRGSWRYVTSVVASFSTAWEEVAAEELEAARPPRSPLSVVPAGPRSSRGSAYPKARHPAKCRTLSRSSARSTVEGPDGRA